MKVIVTADSTCDLGPDICRSHGIRMAPLSVIIGSDVHHDGVDVTPADIFAAAERNIAVKTAAVNEYEYHELFSELLKDGETEIVHVCISSRMSSCYKDAEAAARKLERVHVVDSRSLSSGSGLLVMKALDLAADGMSASEIASMLTSSRDLVDASFTVQQVDYLHRGGRCNGLEALGARLLHIHPCIEVHNGSMAPGKKYRGSVQHYLKHYIEDRLENSADIDLTRAFITHSPCDEETVSLAVERVKSYGLFREVLETPAGCTVCSHCGPNTLGLLFMRKTL